MALHNDPEKTHYAEEVEHTAVLDEKADAAAFKASAIEAENVEHNMTVIQAVKAYPMASFWAFVVSCTIVGRLPHRQRSHAADSPPRSWSPTMFSSWATFSPLTLLLETTAC